MTPFPKKIFKLYLNRLDPGHYYFLEEDIREFQKYETRLDDMLRRGNIEFALDVFSRFKTRLQQRLQQLEGFLKQEFDFSKDGKWKINRRDEPYPKDLEDAKEIWRLKIKFDLLTLKLGGTELEEAENRLMKRVRGLWKDYSQYDDDDVIALFLNAMANAFDPHSAYMAAQELKNFDISIKLSLDGIGAVLRWEDGYTVVNSIIPGGAAARHGKLRVEDRIIAVAQGDDAFESVIDMRLNDVVQLIRGKRGTTVRLQVLRESELGLDTLKFSIVRDKIVLKEGEAQSHIFEPEKASSELPSLKHRIGVIKLPSFYVDFNDRRKNPNNYKSSSRDVKKHLEQFVDSKVDGLILDLRSNGGGGLDEAITMAGSVHRQKSCGGRQAIRRTSRHRSPQPGENDFRKSRPFDAQPLQRFRIGDPGRGASGLPTGDPGGRPDHLRQGHGPEHRPTSGRFRRIESDHCPVLPSFRRFHPEQGGRIQHHLSFRQQCPGHW